MKEYFGKPANTLFFTDMPVLGRILSEETDVIAFPLKKDNSYNLDDGYCAHGHNITFTNTSIYGYRKERVVIAIDCSEQCMISKKAHINNGVRILIMTSYKR